MNKTRYIVREINPDIRTSIYNVWDTKTNTVVVANCIGYNDAHLSSRILNGLYSSFVTNGDIINK